jgi:hypothetical protein
MKTPKFEYEPLGNVIAGLESADDLSLDEIKADLVSRGYDPDAFVQLLKTSTRESSSKSRLAWMEQGQKNQSKLDAALAGIRSWIQRPIAEIDKAFDDVRTGQYGPQAQLHVQTAFRNLTGQSTQTKAAFLDEIDALLALQDPNKNDEKR